MIPFLDSLMSHLLENKAGYLVPIVMTVAAGAYAGSMGQQWLDGRINGHIDVKLVGLQEEVSSIKSLIVASQIRELHALYCKNRSRALQNEIEMLQQKYIKENGKRYPLLPCDDIT